MNNLLTFLVALIGAGAGAYLGSYLKKKGENLATHEDVDKLVSQVATVTQTTKEIEAKISNDVWERQRKWEVKREALFEAVKQLGSFEYALVQLVQVFGNAKNSTEPDGPASRQQMLDATDVWNSALIDFKKAKLLALLVSGQELNNAFDSLELSAITMANETISNKPNRSQSYRAISTQMNALTLSVRKELYID
jgi:hypothetical protein